MQLRTIASRIARWLSSHSAAPSPAPASSSDAPNFGPVRILSQDPPVFLTGIPYDAYLGVAPSFARRYGNVPAGFIVFPTWSIEAAGIAEEAKRQFDRHADRYPAHRFRFICNTERETELLLAQGLPAEFLNKNFTVSDQIFQPLPDAPPPDFDAIYVARFVDTKRHELAAAVPRVAYVTYVEQVTDPRQKLDRVADFHSHYQAALARNPHHALLNRMGEDELPITMTREEVNVALGRAAVGLILSKIEGSSYASMEYLLAGLPVVSTPSTGGRDVYFDPETCIVCEPTPEAVRDAVAELKGRNLSREAVRRRTLDKIEPARRRFLTLVGDLAEELGGRRRMAGQHWPFGEESGVPWKLYASHLDDFETARRETLAEALGFGKGPLTGEQLAALADSRRAALAEELGFASDALAGVQLEATEIWPVVDAVRRRPGCSLLVFGCGRDSVFWERLNEGGTTAFLEDNREWIEATRPSLRASAVHMVRYRTRLAAWRHLLDHTRELAMELPREVEGRRWDVILVDGPAGYDDTTPGRMQAIYAASRLVAPGGCVFVHDCEREAEDAYTSRYLGKDRIFVEARGRALMTGFGF